MKRQVHDANNEAQIKPKEIIKSDKEKVYIHQRLPDESLDDYFDRVIDISVFPENW
jgi:hypothetical protein